MKTQNGGGAPLTSRKLPTLSALAALALGMTAALPASAAPPGKTPAPKPPASATTATTSSAAPPPAPPPPPAGTTAPASSAVGTPPPPPPPPTGTAPGTPAPSADATNPGTPPPPPDAAPPQDGTDEATTPKKKKKRAPQGPTAQDGWGPDPASPPPMAGPRPPWVDESNLPVLPRRIEYEEGDILLPGYELKSAPSRGLFVGGMITFFIPYGLSAFAATINITDGGGNDAEEFGPLLLPVVGPFLSLSQDDGDVKEGYAFIQLANGFAQTAGVAMIAASILFPDKSLQRVEALAGKPQVLFGGNSVSVKWQF